jgi:RNA polymerase sigma-70 factor (ECF subfamily)
MSGDREAFERLVLPLQADLAFAARAMAGQEADAADLVQETLMKAWRSWDSFSPGTRLRPWIFTILRNCHLDRCRARKLRPLALEPEAEPASSGPLPASRSLPEGFSSGLLAALRSLSPFHQLLLLLADVEDLRYREIAEVLGVPLGTVMSGLHHARTRLKLRLLESGPHE